MKELIELLIHPPYTDPFSNFSPVIQPADHEIREKRSGIHLRRFRMKKKILRGRGDGNIINPRSRRVIEQQLNWVPPYHTVFKFFIPSFLGIIVTKYQGKSKDPFETHSIQMWTFPVAIIIYCIMLLALKQLQNYHNKCLEMLSSVALASGVLSSLSLLSLLLPHFHGLVVLHASWALSTVIAAWPLLPCTYIWLLKRLKTLQLNTLISKLFTRSNFSKQEPPMPPV